MAFVRTSSTAEAIACLIRFHNYKVKDRYLRVSFSQSKSVAGPNAGGNGGNAAPQHTQSTMNNLLPTSGAPTSSNALTVQAQAANSSSSIILASCPLPLLQPQRRLRVVVVVAVTQEAHPTPMSTTRTPRTTTPKRRWCSRVRMGCRRSMGAAMRCHL